MTNDLSEPAVLVVDEIAIMRKVVITLLATMKIKLMTEPESATAALLALHEQPLDVIITNLSM